MVILTILFKYRTSALLYRTTLPSSSTMVMWPHGPRRLFPNRTWSTLAPSIIRPSSPPSLTSSNPSTTSSRSSRCPWARATIWRNRSIWAGGRKSALLDEAIGYASWRTSWQRRISKRSHSSPCTTTSVTIILRKTTPPPLRFPSPIRRTVLPMSKDPVLSKGYPPRPWTIWKISIKMKTIQIRRSVRSSACCQDPPARRKKVRRHTLRRPQRTAQQPVASTTASTITWCKIRPSKKSGWYLSKELLRQSL